MMSFMSVRPGFDQEGIASSSSSPSEEDEMLTSTSATTTGGAHFALIEREHMFDKVVTPSDVGKLNRLVIPKQHAEKYFPLDSSSSSDKAAGLLLNFEDRDGKPWRFRYSYWNSSQSYVMTKGWSRFVKDKKLDAGDIVSFHRGSRESAKDRLFIDWRRRPVNEPPPQFPNVQYPSFWNIHNPLLAHAPAASNLLRSNAVVSGAPIRSEYGSYPYNGRSGGGRERVGVVSDDEEQMVFSSVPVVQGKATAKRLRLFGVTMDCPISESDIEQCHSTLPIQHYLRPPNSSNIPSIQFITPYSRNGTIEKGKGSMSLDLDIS